MTDPSAVVKLKTIIKLATELLSQTDGRHMVPEKQTFMKPRAGKVALGNIESAINFKLGERAFFAKYARGLGSVQQFTLAVAYLSKGAVGVEISTASIVKQWSSVAGLMSTKSPKSINMFGTRAKEKAWVDSPKRGIYTLTNDWHNCVKKS